MLDLLILVIQAAAAIGSLVCFSLVVITLMERGKTTMGIICLVTLLCGIGLLIAYIYGLMKMDRYNLRRIMTVWTICIAANLLGYATLAFAVVE